jgi:hypothetical protein
MTIMRKHITPALLSISLIALSGCASSGNSGDQLLAAYQTYIQQQRTYVPVQLIGPNMTITLTGVEAFTLEAPLPPLTAMQSGDVQERAIDAAKNVLLGLGGIWGITQFSTPTVIQQPAPLVVRPEVIAQ